MCGRYSIATKEQKLADRFNIDLGPNYMPTYNAAPTQLLPVISDQSPEGLSMFHWGLIPFWTKGKSSSTKLINARSETIEEKAAFREAFKYRHCLVPADSYFEWKMVGKKAKVPYRILLHDESIFCFAGLWEESSDLHGHYAYSFTIITAKAPAKLAHLHHRVPVILNRSDEGKWLDQDLPLLERRELLKPFPAEEMKYYPISSRVNSPNVNEPSLLNEVKAADQFGNFTLFD
jgi:putative SOS response-associated peptidase YedK